MPFFFFAKGWVLQVHADGYKLAIIAFTGLIKFS